VEKNISYSASGVNTLEIFLSNAEILPFIDEGYRKIQHNVNIPGFRKGKVPRHMMEKMYGKAVENDANIDIVNEYFPKIAKEENIMLIDNPNLKDIQKTDDGVRYIIEFQTVPEFEISDYKTIELYEPQHVVTSDEVEVELEELSLKHAEYEDAESVDSHDFVVHLGVEVVNPEAEDHDHDHDHEGHHHHEHQSVYLRDQRVDSEFRNLFLNRKKGEDFIHTGTTQTGEFQYRYIIEGVQRVNPKPIDDELASLESNNQFTNLDDFRRDLEFRLQDYWDDKTRNEMENQIMDKITRDNSHIIVPASLKESALLSLIDNMKQQYKIKKDDKQFDDMLRSQYDKVAENYARWDMIKNKITKDESIEVEEYDIDDWIAKVKKAFPAYEDAMLRNLINQDENVKNQILSKKVFDFILGFATTNETTFEDFYKQRQMEIAESQKPLVDVEPYDPNEVIDAPEIEEETEEKKD
jgi:trigger factor